MVLPAGVEPAARGSSDHCSTCWATEAFGDRNGARTHNLKREGLAT